MSITSSFIIKNMEEIIQILIFVGAIAIAVVGQNAKNKKKSKTTSPQEVLEDMFPEIEVDQETPIAEPQPAPRPKPVFKRKPRMAPIISPEPPQTTVSQPPKEKEKISLNNQKEARRAFIYSEILNRKY